MNVDTIVVGLGGLVATLSSPIISQWIAGRSSREQAELATQERAEQRAAEQGEAERERRRTCYINLTMASRNLATAYNTHLYRLRNGQVADEDWTRLDEARQAHREVYAEAQMTVPASLLPLAAAQNDRLSGLYGMLKRFERGAPREGETVDVAFAELERVRAVNRGVRDAMRSDLGVN